VAGGDSPLIAPLFFARWLTHCRPRILADNARVHAVLISAALLAEPFLQGALLFASMEARERLFFDKGIQMKHRWKSVVAGLIGFASVAASPAHGQLLNGGFDSGVMGPWANSVDYCAAEPGCLNWSVSSGIGRFGGFGA